MDFLGFNELIEEIKHLDKEDTDFSKKCSSIVLDVQNNKLTILQLIESLGTLLTNPSPSKRELGVIILSEALENLESNSLNNQQLSVICKFYDDRLKDHHQVIPATLRGIIALAKYKNFPDGSATLILSALFQNIACQQQQQPDRLKIYIIFKLFLDKHKTELCSMGLDFVYGVVTAIDSERDPKNLLFLFKWIPNFLSSVSLGHLSEEMFEVLACYFPVDFRAPPQDPNALKREDLSESLCPCLCAIPEFAEHCIPLAIEKLQSSLLIAKIDSLKLLREGCKNFQIDAYVQHSSEIWSLIQKELLSCKDVELEKNCLETLKCVIKKLSNSDSSTFINILRDITDTVTGNILPDAKLFEPSIKLLLYIALACQQSAEFMIKEVVPIITNTYNITKTPAHKAVLLTPLIGFLQAYSIFKNVNDSKELSVIPVFCLKATVETETELRVAGFKCLNEIAKFLNTEVRNAIYNNLTVLLVQKDSKIRGSLISCFKILSKEYPDEVKEHIIDKIQIGDEAALALYLDALREIAYLQYFTIIVVEKLVYYSFENDKLNYIALENVKKLLMEQENNADIYSCVLENLPSILIEKTISSNEIIENDTRLLTTINAILKVTVGFCTSDVQKNLLNEYFDLISACKEKFSNIYITLLDSFLTRLKKDVLYDNIVINDLIQFSFYGSNAFIREYSIKLLANIINKYTDDNSLEGYLAHIKDVCKTCIETNSDFVLEVIAWITKALVMRNSKYMDEWENILIEQLDTYETSAKGFRIVMDESHESLSQKSNCNIAFLYKQKFFTSVSNKLCTNYNSQRTSYLMAIGYLIELVPSQVLLMQFVKLKKLIILCLEYCQEPEVLCVLLNSLKSFIVSGEKVMEDHLEDFLSRFLDLTTFQASMDVRVLALQCLQQYSGRYPVYKLLPFKQLVIRQLGICIDDKKRVVRKEAVQARSLWYLLDAPL